jgi:hypothetical protein
MSRCSIDEHASDGVDDDDDDDDDEVSSVRRQICSAIYVHTTTTTTKCMPFIVRRYTFTTIHLHNLNLI